MADATFSGGDKLQDVLKNAGKGGVKSVDVGVFKTARYKDGTTVAEVAIANEFGTSRIPERPAIRNANKSNEKTLIRLIRANTDPEKMIIDKHIAGLIGTNHQGATQKSIIDLRVPPNSPATVTAKKSSNPLVDTGKYVRSITYKVNP